MGKGRKGECDKVGDVGKGQILQGFVGYGKVFGIYLSIKDIIEEF